MRVPMLLAGRTARKHRLHAAKTWGRTYVIDPSDSSRWSTFSGQQPETDPDAGQSREQDDAWEGKPGAGTMDAAPALWESKAEAAWQKAISWEQVPRLQ
jgi:hypothetical protein